MTPFFRRIRLKLANENKFLKYSRYAIGEIVLVVIGILIALQINNWNEEKKSESETKRLMVKVRKELFYNIKQANRALDYYFKRDSLVYKVIKKKATAFDYKNNWDYKELPWDYETVSAVNDDFLNLLEKSTLISPEQDSILLRLKALYAGKRDDLDDWDNYVGEVARDFKDKIKDEHSWFSDHRARLVTDEMIDYFINDPYYFNAVHDVAMISYNLHLGRIVTFRIEAGDLYKEISDYLGLKVDSIVDRKHEDYSYFIGKYILKNNPDYTVEILKGKNDKLKYIIFFQDSIQGTEYLYPYSKNHLLKSGSAWQFTHDAKNEIDELIIIGLYGSGYEDRPKVIKVD